MVAETMITSRNEKTVIAGNRKTFRVRKLTLPANAICTSSRTIAGTQVTRRRNAIRIASFPNTYSTRDSGFER